MQTNTDMTESTSPKAHADWVIITPSYWADYENAKALSESIDRHLKFAFEHVLIVARRDLRLFAKLAGPNRRVITIESVLGRHGFRLLPFPRQIVIPGLFRRRFKEQWMHPKAGRISGWTLQQLIKLSSNTISGAFHIMFIDSDVEIVKDVGADTFLENGLTKFHEHSGGVNLATHRQWRHNARMLIGRDESPDLELNYIGNMIVWRSETLKQLQDRIEIAHGCPWWLKLAQVKNISEYILYGTFLRLEGGMTGHAPGELGLVHSQWLSGGDEDARFMTGMTPRHIAVHIQSTVAMTPNERRAKIDGLRNRVAAGASQ